MEEVVDPEQLRAEIARLEASKTKSDDEDIRLAIQAVIDSLESKLIRHAAGEAPIEDEEVFPEIAPEVLREVENLIRMSRLERTRGNTAKANQFLNDAIKLAPTASLVLETQGDEFFERKKWGSARIVYERALKSGKPSLDLERKHAEAALKDGEAAAVMAGGFDSLLISESDRLANAQWAGILSFIVPGVGQLAVGKTKAGFGFLAGWVVCVLLLAIFRRDLAELGLMIVGRGGRPNTIILFPLIAMLTLSVTAAGTVSKKMDPMAKKPSTRPEPPANLPFE